MPQVQNFLPLLADSWVIVRCAAGTSQSHWILVVLDGSVDPNWRVEGGFCGARDNLEGPACCIEGGFEYLPTEFEEPAVRDEGGRAAWGARVGGGGDDPSDSKTSEFFVLAC